MGTYRPLRLVFFIYDAIRLVVMTSLLITFVQPAPSDGGGVFPYLFYAVPNGLFPLMSFFLLVNLSAHKPFIALYMAGKIIAVVAVLAWLIFSLPRISLSFVEDARSIFAVAGTVLLLSAGDALSVFGGMALKRRMLDVVSVDNGPEKVPEEGN
jgi:hypothetical protein